MHGSMNSWVLGVCTADGGGPDGDDEGYRLRNGRWYGGATSATRPLGEWEGKKARLDNSQME